MTTEFIAQSIITPVLYGLIASALYYLGSRAKITSFLWSHYPPAFDRFMMCAACTGFWLGLGLAFGIGWWRDLPFLLLPGRFWLTPIVVAISSVVLTPLFAAAHLRALEYTSAMPLEEPEPEPEASEPPVSDEAAKALGNLGTKEDADAQAQE